MSTEDLLNQPSASAERPPDQDYVPMPVESEPKKKTYESDSSGLHRAAADLDKARDAILEQQPRLLTDEQGIVERKYQRLKDGSPIPLNETITAERAAEDLTNVRETDIRTVSPTL